LGEETSFLSQFAGPPGAAAAKGLGAAALGAAAGKKLLKGAAEEGAEMAGKGIRAYHGSPHEFERFSTEHIGTGEGGQAYGHGLYFAENEPTALSYKHSTSDLKDWGVTGNSNWRLPSWLAKQINSSPKAGLDEGIANFEKRLADMKAENHWNVGGIQDIVDALHAIKRGDAKLIKPGHMYEVEINAPKEKFLDWDKPLSEQHSAIKEKVFKALGAETPLVGQTKTGRWITMDEKGNVIGRADGWPDQATAREAAKVLSQDAERMLAKTPGELLKSGSQAINKDRTQKLRDAGIPGIRYLDQGSRGSEGGTYNYVVFDENLIKVIRKYGIAGLATLPPAVKATLTFANPDEAAHNR
jgi:hypothetical protein